MFYFEHYIFKYYFIFEKVLKINFIIIIFIESHKKGHLDIIKF